jgi:16S rRNA (cytidine1402-2'-O)-methyltransferase
MSGLPGTLYVVATPIGNLDDWSARGRSVVEGADLLLAEDTRETRSLLSRYGIRVKLESYHDFSERTRAASILERLQSGLRVALVSDRGTPTISDPGYRLVRMARDAGIPVIPVPGPSAAIAALSVSGLPTDEFYFTGFLPSRAEARRRRLESLARVRATLVFYEAPHRLDASLEDLEAAFGDRLVFLAREMTKVHEEYLLGRLSEMRGRFTARGEVVVVVEGRGEADEPGEPELDLGSNSRQELLTLLARRLGVNRRALYEALYKKEGAR